MKLECALGPLAGAEGDVLMVERQQGEAYTIPEWVYVAQGQPIPSEPAEDERRTADG